MENPVDNNSVEQGLNELNNPYALSNMLKSKHVNPTEEFVNELFATGIKK